MQRIVFLDRSTLEADLRSPAFAHEWIDYAETRPGEVVERLREATIAVTNKVVLSERELSRLPNLRLIAVAATGTDIIDLEYCRRHSIAVRNVRGYARRTVPEHVLMLILALRRNLVAYHEDIRQGAWQRARQFCLLTHPIRDLHESTLGIVGYGAIGRGVETLARAFGMNILIAEHKQSETTRTGRTPFRDVLRRSDIITLHAPLNDETRHMIGEAELELMRENALLINSARGGLVDEVALAGALRAGRIAGAGIDVLSREPPRQSEGEDSNPLLSLRLPNLIITPHVAWASREAMQALADQLIDNIEEEVKKSDE